MEIASLILLLTIIGLLLFLGYIITIEKCGEKEIIVPHKAEKDTDRGIIELNTTVTNVKEVISKVNDEIITLNAAFSNNKVRGDFGEKFADDILKKLGFVEGINYVRQTTNVEGVRPDFTFLLASGIKCNMDSKFPLNNYLRYKEAGDKGYLVKFLKDVRDRIKEVSAKAYIGEGTTDFVIIFLPNTAVYEFILEQDPEIMDFAFENKTVLCSPFSLYLVLKVFSQVSHLFNLDKKTYQALSKLEKFFLEWKKYQEEKQKFDKKLDDLIELNEKLNGVRTRTLDKVVGEMK